VDERELIAKAGVDLPLSKNGPEAAKVLDGGEDLSALFGLDIEKNSVPATGEAKPKPSPTKSGKMPVKAAAKKTAKAVAKKTAAVKKSPVKTASKTEPKETPAEIRKRKFTAARAKQVAQEIAANLQASAEAPVAKKPAAKSTKRVMTVAERKRLTKLQKARWAELKKRSKEQP
jgi:hypothetical protein